MAVGGRSRLFCLAAPGGGSTHLRGSQHSSPSLKGTRGPCWGDPGLGLRRCAGRREEGCREEGDAHVVGVGAGRLPRVLWEALREDSSSKLKAA